ncbi:alpha/beta hydrolase [Actinomycetospora endophytica]|uniref:Alpha/beta hydrolase n=1 Tax=Actinomycetospora endophytica TaxID=2291215 RepID=A0ABS8P896_9PSEU|nr:alpha/beta hydrolase [Actinomycetospora endophytica]MCD2194506.1 alpha/beta hydrolase [Actinomycetospora endophytica]
MWWNSVVGLGLEQAGRATIGLSGLRHRSVGTQEAVDHPGEGPVVLLGGLGETRPCLEPMTLWLTRLGYDVTPYTIAAGMGCSQRTVTSLTRRVRELADQAGQPVRLVGHSRGGQFGRAVGVEAPEAVSHLVTIGTPFDLWGLSPLMTFTAWALGAAGTVGVPGLFGLNCLVGHCCAGFRDALRAPWPEDLPFTSIYSRSDGAVPWRSSHDPYAQNVEVSHGHVAQLTSAATQRAVGAALARAPHERLDVAA